MVAFADARRNERGRLAADRLLSKAADYLRDKFDYDREDALIRKLGQARSTE